PNKFENIVFYQHQVYNYVFNGSISAPVYEKLKAGTKVLELG
ncbi:3530_t:CDS:1, partial [Gigaspora margarita]